VGEPDGPVGGDLRHRPHGRVQRCRAPDDIGEQPAGVDQSAFVAADQGQDGIADVGAEQQHQCEAQQPIGRGARPGAGGQAGHHDQQQHISQRVGQRDQPLWQRQRRVGGDRLHQERPRQQAEPGGDDGRVDEPGPVATRDPPADQDQQSHRQDGVAAHIERIGDRREGALMENLVDDGVQHVADDEQELTDREAPPDQRAGRPVAAHPDQDHGDRRQADQVVGKAAPQPLKGQQEVQDHRDHATGQVQPPDSSAHGPPIGRTPRSADTQPRFPWMLVEVAQGLGDQAGMSGHATVPRLGCGVGVAACCSSQWMRSSAGTGRLMK
jgi:hypothetical protein